MTSGTGQQLLYGCDPGAGSSPPSRARSAWRTPSQALRRRSDRSHRDPRALLFLLCLGCASRAPPSGRSRTRTEQPGCRAQSRAPCGAARGRAGGLPACPSRRSARGPRNAPHRGAGRELGPPNPASARACGGFGAGGLQSETVTQTWRNRRVGTCRPGGRGRRRLRYAPPLGSPGPGRPRAARPAPARAASLPARKEPAERPRQLTQAVRGRPVTAGARGPGDAVVSVPFVGGRPNELSARTSRVPPP